MKLISNSHSKAWPCCGFAPALDLALLKSARRERAALPGAPMARQVGGGKAPQGWLAGMRASSTSGQEPCRRIPVAHLRTRRAGEGMDARVEATQGAVARGPQGAPSGWPFSWVTFSLATQRESDSAAVGRRKLFALNAGTSNSIARERAPTTSPRCGRRKQRKPFALKTASAGNCRAHSRQIRQRPPKNVANAFTTRSMPSSSTSRCVTSRSVGR